MNKQRKTKEEVEGLERTLSAEERIRRAEEIYQRRKMQGGVRVPSSNVNSKPKVEYSLFKKLILQIAICLLIYFIFYLIKNSNYIFSENVISKTKEFLSYDINFQNVYKQAEEYYNNNIKAFLLQKDENTEQNAEQENQTDNEQEQNNSQANEQQANEQLEENGQENNEQVNNEKANNIEESNEIVEGGIGGGEEGEELLANETIVASTSQQENNQAVEEVQLSQMEIDANDIKNNYSIILPLKGTITSRFGPREPTDIVSANHAGIDIAANAGTIFTAAMEGKVTCVSTEGGYGNHVYIEKDDVITLYAHCQAIYVKEGDTIAQGQQIGEVGESGNATGPHLHFEVRKANRVVNPELILSFA